MKKYIYIGIASAIVIVACILIIILKPSSQSDEIKPVSIKIVETSLPTKSYEFLISDINVRIDYSNDTYKIVSLDQSMISENDYNKLSTIGKHIIVVSHLGFITDFKIEIIPKPIYKVTFYDNADNILSEQMVEIGSDAVAPIDTFVEGYTFKGWSIDFTNIQSDLIVEGIYEKDPVYYTVKFKCGVTGEILREEIVKEGGEVTPPEPLSFNDHKFLYWDGKFTNVNTNMIITAVYEELYRVTFADKNGNRIKVEYVEMGGKATPPDEPTDVPEGYFFAGWDGDFNYITERKIFFPVYKKLEEKYYIQIVIDNYRPSIKNYFMDNNSLCLTVYTSQELDIDFIIYPLSTPQEIIWKIISVNANATIDPNGKFISHVEETVFVIAIYSDGETEVRTSITIYVRN